MPHLHDKDEKQPKSRAAANSPHFQQEGIASFTPPPFKVTAGPIPQMKEEEEALQKKQAQSEVEAKNNNNLVGGAETPVSPPNPNEPILTTLQRKHNAYRPEPKQYKRYELPTQQKSVKQFKQHEPFQLKDSPAYQKRQEELPQEVQAKMENSMGHDFSNVTIHKDSQNATDAGALAYAQGNDVHFAPGQFKTDTTSGQELIGHELAHVVQQREGRVKPTKMLGKGMAVNDDPALEKEADDMGRKAANAEISNSKKAKKIDLSIKTTQFQVEPEDVSREMIGKTFIVNKSFTIKSGTVRFPQNQEIQIISWDNDNTSVGAKCLSSDGQTYTFDIPKSWLTPKRSGVKDMHHYSAGVMNKTRSVESGKNDIQDWKNKRPEYELYGTIEKFYTPELKRLNDRQVIRNSQLNKSLIQETMFNSLDSDIVKWVNHYHKEIGKAKGWKSVDKNLVKSIIFQESQMGTVGEHLLQTPRHKNERKTRFNVMQAIDSSGPQQLTMIKENSPMIYTKYNLAEEKTKILTEIEKNRKLDNGIHPNSVYTRNPKWRAAVNDFFAETSPARNMDYSFWVQTGIRWLYHKRSRVNSWEEAARAYNGGGSRATNYKRNVTTRHRKATSAHQSGAEFIPKVNY